MTIYHFRPIDSAARLLAREMEAAFNDPTGLEAARQLKERLDERASASLYEQERAKIEAKKSKEVEA